jgi:kynurenine formamidase
VTRAVPFGFTKVVFLSHVIDPSTPVFPGDPPVEIHPAATIERDGYYLQSLVVLDVRTAVAGNADLILGVEEIRQWEATYGPIPQDSAVIMRTGFEERWDDPAAYLNADPGGGLHYPGFGGDATRWLIEHRSISALGIDTMGIDPGADTGFHANRLLLQHHRMHLENLCGLGELPPVGGWIIVGGIRIHAGSGSPATMFGLIP